MWRGFIATLFLLSCRALERFSPSGDKKKKKKCTETERLTWFAAEVSRQQAKHRVLLVVAQGQSSANYAVVVHLAYKRGKQQSM